MATLKWRTLVVLSLLVVVAVALMAYSVRWPLVTFLNVISEQEVDEPLRVSCQDVLKRMVYGRWETRSLSVAEESEIKLFNEQVRKEKTIPGNLQHSDKLCGNTTFPNVVFRALCDANGDTPCCCNNVCTNRTKEQCTCANCYDTCRPLHGEYATCRPVDHTFRLRHFLQTGICQLLDGASLYFIGDSFVKHVYTSFLLAARDNEISGEKCSNIPIYMRTACSGLYMFTETVCRLYVDGHTKVRKEWTIPNNLQRSDRLCGNITFPKIVFRALCDPNGDTPCCYNNVCTNRTKEQCACANCYDTRRPLHAEYATWRPLDPTCRLHHFSQNEICQLLDGATLYFIGDSFVRHVYTAFLLAARNNEFSGAMLSNTPADIRRSCAGLYMFTEKVCRLHVDGDTKLCNSTVTARLYYYYNLDAATSILNAISTLTNVNRSIVFFGVGIHDRFNVQNVQQKLLLPLLQKMNSSNTRSPRLVWMAVHAPGLLRSPNFPWQSADGVLKYNSIMAQFLSQWRVPVFDAFNLTDRADSFDGEHYGLGVNRVKVQLLLNYILELQDKMLW